MFQLLKYLLNFERIDKINTRQLAAEIIIFMSDKN